VQIILAGLVGDLTTDQLPALVVSGVILGSLYFLLASGLVVVYRLTNTLNFAQGGLATFGAFVFYLELQPELPDALAFAVSALAGAALAAAIDRLSLRGLHGAPDAAVRSVVITIGWMLLLPELVIKIWGSTTAVVTDVFPTGGAFMLGDVTVTKNQLGIFLTTIGMSILLTAFLRWSPLGLMIRAVASNEDAAMLLGIRIGLVSAVSWGIAGIFGATAGIFLSPNLSLNPFLITLFVIPAFAAAAIGRLHSLGLAFVGAMALGIGSNVVASAFPRVRGARESVPFALIMVALIVQSALASRSTRVARA
jgi:branched-chain amino acid transport system permease protein